MTTQQIQEATRQERLAYYKEWRSRNKDKVKRHNENFWRKRAEQRLKEGEANGQ